MAIDDLNANIQALGAAVTTAVQAITAPHPTEDQIKAAADAVAANTARLAGALNPPVVVPPPAA